MTNYIKADIRRILHKNTFLIAVGIFLALYAGMVFIYFNPLFTADMYVAETLGVSRQSVSKWEKGTSDPNTSNLIALAKLYGISAEELLKNVENN